MAAAAATMTADGSVSDDSDGDGDDGDDIGNSDGAGGCLSIADSAPGSWCGVVLLALISISRGKRRHAGALDADW
jgi:hypothetical protein